MSPCLSAPQLAHIQPHSRQPGEIGTTYLSCRSRATSICLAALAVLGSASLGLHTSGICNLRQPHQGCRRHSTSSALRQGRRCMSDVLAFRQMRREIWCLIHRTYVSFEMIMQVYRCSGNASSRTDSRVGASPRNPIFPLLPSNHRSGFNARRESFGLTVAYCQSQSASWSRINFAPATSSDSSTV